MCGGGWVDGRVDGLVGGWKGDEGVGGWLVCVCLW